MEHTPGPWEFDDSEVGSCYGDSYYGLLDSFGRALNVRIMFYQGSFFGRAESSEEQDKQARANAKLVAAAPKLLEALQELEQEASKLALDNYEHFSLRMAIAKAQAMIEKASA